MRLNGIFKRINLKKRILFAYVLLIIIPMPLVAVVNYSSSMTAMEGKTQKQLGVTGNVINDQFDNYFKDIAVISDDILKDEMIQKSLSRSGEDVSSNKFENATEQKEITDYFMGICARKPGISDIILYGNNNFDSFFSASYSWNSDFDSSKEQWFKDAIDANGGWVLTGKRQEGQLFKIGGKSKEGVVTFSQMIKDTSSFKPLGVLQINISIEHLEKIGIAAVDEGSVSIYDKDGNQIVENIIGKKSDVLEVSKVSSYTHWKTVYDAPKKELFKEMGEIRNFIILVTILSIIVAVFFANFISSSIAKPVKMLRERMKRAAEGDFETRIEYDAQDEISELIDGFNHMTFQVKALIHEIQDKEKQRLKTEIDALQARINPHFIYNTLNSIRLIAMMDGNEKITGLLTSFVYLLKFASKNKGTLISIQDEMSILEAYTDLMRFRYENFKLALAFNEDIRKLLTVPFILQPLVENSIFHGLAPAGRQGLIEVDIVQKGDSVHVCVRDNGVGMDSETVGKILAEDTENKNSFSSIGVKNVYDRLKLHFGENASMKIESVKGKGTAIELSWPALTGGRDIGECNDRG